MKQSRPELWYQSAENDISDSCTAPRVRIFYPDGSSEYLSMAKTEGNNFKSLDKFLVVFYELTTMSKTKSFYEGMDAARGFKRMQFLGYL